MQRTKPPFRADHVGSLLRTAPLKEARAKHAEGKIDDAALAAVEDREIEKIIKKQEDVGLKLATDGEFRRSWWHLDFLWGLDGAEKHVMDTGIAFAGVRTRNEGVQVTGKLGFSGHPMIEHYKFVAARTTRTPKMTIPAPSAIYGRPSRTPINASVYPRLDRFFDGGVFCVDLEDRASIAGRAVGLARERAGDSVAPESMFVIGDTPADVRCGKAIGARTVAVASGSHSAEELAACEPWLVLDELPPPETFASMLGVE